MRSRYVALLLVLAAARPVAAQRTSAAEGDRLFREGVELFADEQYADALQKFQASRRHRETGTVVYNIANCLRALARNVEAIEAYARFIEIRGDRLGRQERQEVDEIVAELHRRVVELRVTTTPEGAAVFVNGRPLETQPLLLDVGTEVVAEGRMEGYRSARTTTRVNAPGPFELMLTLERGGATTTATPTPPPTSPERVTETPARPEENGGRSAPPAATALTPEERDEEGGSALPWVLVGAGVVAVAAGVGIYFLVADSGPPVAWEVTTP